MITMILGKPRVGKTALMTYFAGRHLTVKAREDVVNARWVIKRLNANGFNLTVPPKHIVYANYEIIGKQPGQRSRAAYAIDGYDLGLPNERHKTAFFPPYSKIFLDEAQQVFNCRGSINFPDWASRFFEMHGHNFLDIWMTCQRPGLVDINIREIVNKLIEVLSLKNYFDRYGQLAASKWQCLEFDDFYTFQQYQQGGRKVSYGKRTTYEYKGDIFKCYNSRNFFPFFYKDRYTEDFSKKENEHTGYSLEGIKLFNETHVFERPDTYKKIQSAKNKE